MSSYHRRKSPPPLPLLPPARAPRAPRRATGRRAATPPGRPHWSQRPRPAGGGGEKGKRERGIRRGQRRTACGPSDSPAQDLSRESAARGVNSRITSIARDPGPPSRRYVPHLAGVAHPALREQVRDDGVHERGAPYGGAWGGGGSPVIHQPITERPARQFIISQSSLRHRSVT